MNLLHKCAEARRIKTKQEELEFQVSSEFSQNVIAIFSLNKYDKYEAVAEHKHTGTLPQTLLVCSLLASLQLMNSW